MQKQLFCGTEELLGNKKAVGYLRYDTPQELDVLNELYRYLRLYVNFFQPVMKLKEKTRIGGKVKKRYDTAKTPYQRILQSEHIHGTIKDRLKRQYEKFNPAELKRNIMEFATSKMSIKKKGNFVYNFYEATKKYFL